MVVFSLIYWGNKGSTYHFDALLPLVFKTTNGTRTSNSAVRSLALKRILLVMFFFLISLAWKYMRRFFATESVTPINTSPALPENLHLFMNHPKKPLIKHQPKSAQTFNSYPIPMPCQPTQPEEWYSRTSLGWCPAASAECSASKCRRGRWWGNPGLPRGCRPCPRRILQWNLLKEKNGWLRNFHQFNGS